MRHHSPKPFWMSFANYVPSATKYCMPTGCSIKSHYVAVMGCGWCPAQWLVAAAGSEWLAYL